MRTDNKLGLPSSAEKETYGVLGDGRRKCKSHTDNDIVERK